ncbi:hypothetical protein SAMN05421856_106136 [Chryseobacterium taichungense]|uniref:Uncharacterized protein n=1 Tax=Chryseobacterium taichungense TaxID=295069 RepID=A0A1H8AXJ5_9FLAO|nr:hypothetical protein [Chryseobacterium taichungense]SEM75472.1 hypothetical protein SAMN05421856_106136 [Chryseobacterium taichungense]
MKTDLILLFFVLFSFGSCISDEESARQVNSGFQGNWSGNFTGDDNGSVTFVVQKEGTIVGEINLLPSNIKESINGYVNFDGKFDMNTKSNYRFSGYLKDSKSNGIWTKNNLTGNFSFQKE